MDIGLSGKMDGVTAARYIFQLFQMPVVFLTAHYDEQLLERAKTAQPLGYILKPFTDKELVSNVELALYNHSIRKKNLDAYPIGEPRQIMEAPALVIVLDIQGRIVFYNPYTVRFLDISDEEVLAHNWREVMILVNDQTGEEIPDPVPEVVRQKLEVTFEFNTGVVTQSGKSSKVGVTVRPVKDEKNELVGVLMQIKEKTLDPIRMKTRK
jgi:PAS domain S-box-containing protein